MGFDKPVSEADAKSMVEAMKLELNHPIANIQTIQSRMLALYTTPGVSPEVRDQQTQTLAAQIAEQHALLKTLPAESQRPPAWLQQAGPLGMSGPSASQMMGCRLYVGSLNYDITEAHLRAIFSPFGPVKSVDMSFEPATGRTKGFGFVEYYDPMSAANSLVTLSLFDLGGRRLKVGRPSSLPGGAGPVPTILPGVLSGGVEGQLDEAAGQAAVANANSMGVGGTMNAAGAAPAAGGGPVGVANPDARIYVGNIGYELNSDHIRQIFEPFGSIRSVDLPSSTDGTGSHRGYGFVEYDLEDSANNAITAMHGFNVAGRQLRVGKANAQGQGGGAGGVGSASAGGANAVPLGAAAAGMAGVGQLAALHALVAGSAGGGAAGGQQAPTRVVVLKNMVLPGMVDPELEAEVREECISLGGAVDGVLVHQRSAEEAGNTTGDVLVCVTFGSVEGAVRAQAQLDKRYFDERVVSAVFITEGRLAAKDFMGI
jgi:poly(U)-binding-splicing factor PUF60